jgi:hypothetical protein
VGLFGKEDYHWTEYPSGITLVNISSVKNEKKFKADTCLYLVGGTLCGAFRVG